MNDTQFSVADQVVLLTGASRGIGRAMAAGFAARGARVFITGREAATLTRTAQEISPPERAVTPIVCDVSDNAAIQACVDQVLESAGQIDTLINVAGINQRQPAEDYTEAQYDHIVDTNLKGAFLMSQAVGRHMIERRQGCQINIDSLNTYAPLTQVVPYAISKGGMNLMTRGLAQEWGRHNIRVNGIAPGFIVTDLSRSLWERPTMRDWAEHHTPLQRLGQVEDLVGAAVFLASSAAAFITGQTLRVDGGMSAGIPWPIDQPG